MGAGCGAPLYWGRLWGGSHAPMCPPGRSHKRNLAGALVRVEFMAGQTIVDKGTKAEVGVQRKRQCTG